MSKKVTLSFLFIFSLLAIIFGYSLSFANPVSKKAVYTPSSDIVFLGDRQLSQVALIIDSEEDVSNFSVNGDCDVRGKVVWNRENMHVALLEFGDKKCNKKQAAVALHYGSVKALHTFHIKKKLDLYGTALDSTVEELQKISAALDKVIAKHTKKEQSFINTRKQKEFIYLQSVIDDIISKRKEKYKIPVENAKLPTQYTLLPNAPRPYRKAYTDGIHHGFDFLAEKGTPVVAMDDGVIVRIVKDFKYEDLAKIKHKEDLTYDERLENLDVLRGGQVWLKTMKGDVAFYSHLEEVFDDIAVGDIVSKGQPLGTIGVTGVPGKSYKDYHLHLAIQKNPYIFTKKGKNTFKDYMKWNWYFKGKTHKEILTLQKELFDEGK